MISYWLGYISCHSARLYLYAANLPYRNVYRDQQLWRWTFHEKCGWIFCMIIYSTIIIVLNTHGLSPAAVLTHFPSVLQESAGAAQTRTDRRSGRVYHRNSSYCYCCSAAVLRRASRLSIKPLSMIYNNIRSMLTLQPVSHVERPDCDSRLACLDQAIIRYSIDEPLYLRCNDLASFFELICHAIRKRNIDC